MFDLIYPFPSCQQVVFYSLEVSLQLWTPKGYMKQLKNIASDGYSDVTPLLFTSGLTDVLAVGKGVVLAVKKYT